MARILVIEDNRELAYGLRLNLEVEGHDVFVVHNGIQGLNFAMHRAYHLIVLDLMLPGLDGFRLLEALNERCIPVLVLSAKGGEEDKVRCLDLGADDYVTKPFSLLELLARIRALLRRAAVESSGVPTNCRNDDRSFALRQGVLRDPNLHCGRIAINVLTRTVKHNGKSVLLRPREFDLLVAFVVNPRVVLTRERLLTVVWGHRVTLSTRTVDVHVARLRKVFEVDPKHPRHFLTVKKLGYRFMPESSASLVAPVV